jgi:hypothetical protein
MKSAIATIAFLVAMVTTTSVADAGVFADDLSKCLVNSTSDSDKTVLVVWIYSAMNTHPAIAAYSKMTADQRGQATKQGAELLVRLLTSDCRTQTIAAFRNEGQTSLDESFAVLGRVAMEQLMRDPTVQKNLGSLASYFENNAPLKALLKESGQN